MESSPLEMAQGVAGTPVAGASSYHPPYKQPEEH